MNQSGIPSEESPNAQANFTRGKIEIRVGTSYRYVDPNDAEGITDAAFGRPAQVRYDQKPAGPDSKPE
jgi:hypothetical protein